MIRWLTLVVGVGVAAAALYVLLSSTPVDPRPRPALPSVAAPPARTPTHGDIDEASRARLEQVLRETEEDAR